MATPLISSFQLQLYCFICVLFLQYMQLSSAYQYTGVNDIQHQQQYQYQNRRTPNYYQQQQREQFNQNRQQRPEGAFDESDEMDERYDGLSRNYGNYKQQQQQQQLQQQQQQQQQAQQHEQYQPSHRQNQQYSVQLKNRHVKQHMGILDRQQNKCRKWIPSETLTKYKWASKIQDDQSKSLVFVEVCCDGYGPLRWGGSTYCRPICENCRNGYCEAPGICKCYEEYVQNDNGDCIFTCPLGCLNGQCYLDGTCQCNNGFKLDETRKFCRPICTGGCGLNPAHNCTEPEVCGCSKGYQLMDEGCRPSCQPDCGIGGKCIGYNQCECHPGYNLKDQVCQAECYQKCDNGFCYSRNRCICKTGYTYHESSTQCVPI